MRTLNLQEMEMVSGAGNYADKHGPGNNNSSRQNGGNYGGIPKTCENMVGFGIISGMIAGSIGGPAGIVAGGALGGVTSAVSACDNSPYGGNKGGNTSGGGYGVGQCTW